MRHSGSWSGRTVGGKFYEKIGFTSRNLIIAAHPDVLIFGAGLIGLSLAMELRTRGLGVTVLDPRPPLSGASTAAAGMLAVEDPHNSAALLPFSRLSGSLYAAFLLRVKELSGVTVPFQTEVTLQMMPDGTRRALPEHSLDPRQLAPALLRAVLASGAQVLSGVQAGAEQDQLRARTHTTVHTAGAWPLDKLPIFPRKGQMLRVRIPNGLRLDVVHRDEKIYVVPRTSGPQAGTALIGATVENAGFDLSIDAASLAGLRRLAGHLVPALENAADAPEVEAWAGLRPATPDGLPLLGELRPPTNGDRQRHFVATGHFRNGVLLAPATAVIMADLLEGLQPAVDPAPFSPGRFAQTAEF